MKRSIFFLSLLGLMLLGACSGSDSKDLAGGIDLQEISENKVLNPREKADKMMEALNGVLRSVAQEKDNAKAAAMLDAYVAENGEVLGSITDGFGEWSLTASQEEMMEYIKGLQQKSFYAELDSNLTLVGYRMTESPELEKSMTKLLALINPPA